MNNLLNQDLDAIPVCIACGQEFQYYEGMTLRDLVGIDEYLDLDSSPPILCEDCEPVHDMDFEEMLRSIFGAYL